MPLIQQVLLLTPLLYLAALIDGVIGPRLQVAGIAPDAFALLAILWLWYCASAHGYVTAAAIGLATDVCGSGRLGVGMACYLLVGYMVCALREQRPHSPVLARLSWMTPAPILLLMLLAGCRWLLGETPAEFSTVCLRAAGAGVYTAALLAAAWLTFGQLGRRQLHGS